MFTAKRRQTQSHSLKPAHSRGGGSSVTAVAVKDVGAEEARISTPPDLSIRRRLIVRWNSLFLRINLPIFQIDETLKKAIIAKGYVTPTPIQDVAIPHILKGEDLRVSPIPALGKTGAFLIPLINKVRLDRKQQVLIIAPTRELAIQIDSELKGFTAGMKIYSVCVVGGMSIGRQISELRYQYNFIIGTPGRLKDLINRGMIHLSEFNTVVVFGRSGPDVGYGVH